MELLLTRQSHHCPKRKGRVQLSLKTKYPSTELTRKVSAGSRVAKMPDPTGSRGLPPANAWQDWFTIRLRTWANVISPEFAAVLVKKVLGQQADLSRHGTADRQLAHEISFNIDDKMLPYLLAADLSSGLRDPECVAQRNPCQHGRAHGSSFTRGLPSLSLPRQNDAVVDVETVAHRPPGVAGSGKQSLKTVTGGVRDLNNVNEVKDQLVPNDLGKALLCH